MNKNVFLLPVFASLIFWVACNEQDSRKDGDLVLAGKLENAQSAALFFEELTPADLIPIDSIYTDADGNFEYSLFIEDAGFYRLGTSPANFITLSIEPNQTIHITADFENLPLTYQVEGSEGSYLVWEINNKKMSGMQKADSLRVVYRDSRDNPDFENIREDLRAQYRQVKDDFRAYVIDVIEKNPDNLASVLALYQYFEDHMLLKENEHFEYFENLSKSLCNAYPSNKHVIDLKKRVNDYKRDEQQRLLNEKNLAIGNEAPEIVLPAPDGRQVSLTSLRGNLVLIDFWAAWCPPCRAANAKLGDIYKKYRHQGFEVYGVSLDRTREQWLAAIEVDNITWTQVSDLRFMNSPVVTLYNIAEIPHTVLLDREGKIIARNFNIDHLEELLKENL